MTFTTESRLSAKEFIDSFSDCLAWYDYIGAHAFCQHRLHCKPGDEQVLVLDAACLELQGRALESKNELPTSMYTLADLETDLQPACAKAFEGIFAFLQDEAALDEIGEQAVG